MSPPKKIFLHKKIDTKKNGSNRFIIGKISACSLNNGNMENLRIISRFYIIILNLIKY